MLTAQRGRGPQPIAESPIKSRAVAVFGCVDGVVVARRVGEEEAGVEFEIRHAGVAIRRDALSNGRQVDRSSDTFVVSRMFNGRRQML